MAITEHANGLPRAYILLRHGAMLDLLNPSSDSWTDEDLATGLARTLRWAGQSRWPQSLTVAQHSLLVLAIRRQEEPQLSDEQALYELLHDAEEGLLGFDCITPLKPILGEGFKRLCDALKSAIGDRYALPVPTSLQWDAHKRADRIAAASEGKHVVGWTEDQLRDELGILERPLAVDPIKVGRFSDWEPWPAPFAARAWLAELTATIARNQDTARLTYA